MTIARSSHDTTFIVVPLANIGVVRRLNDGGITRSTIIVESTMVVCRVVVHLHRKYGGF